MTEATATAQNMPPAKPKERPPEDSWRYFLSDDPLFSAGSTWGSLSLRIFIFGLFPQVTGLVQREFFNTLSGSASAGLDRRKRSPRLWSALRWPRR